MRTGTRRATTDLETKVLAFVVECPGSGPDDVAAHLGVSKPDVWRALRRLKRIGAVTWSRRFGRGQARQLMPVQAG